jgi:hypothetical protein
MSSAQGIAAGIANYNSTSSRLRAVVCTEKTRNTLRTDPAGPFSAIFIRTSLYSLHRYRKRPAGAKSDYDTDADSLDSLETEYKTHTGIIRPSIQHFLRIGCCCYTWQLLAVTELTLFLYQPLW